MVFQGPVQAPIAAAHGNVLHGLQHNHQENAGHWNGRGDAGVAVKQQDAEEEQQRQWRHQRYWSR